MHPAIPCPRRSHFAPVRCAVGPRVLGAQLQLYGTRPAGLARVGEPADRPPERTRFYLCREAVSADTPRESHGTSV
jgi:hypothetical protein